MATSTTRRRFSKFIRHPQQYPSHVNLRDLDILKLIHDYRFMASDHITHLIGGSNRKVLERLQRLFHHGYVDRLADRQIRTRSGSEKMVYAITNKAAPLLADYLGVDIAKVNWTWKNRIVTERHIKHTVMIAKFRATLTLAAAQHSDLNLDFWKENRGSGRNIHPDLSDTVVLNYGAGKKDKRLIVPDGFMSVTNPRCQHFLFLEADRSTMTHEKFAKKLTAYWTWWKQGGSKKTHQVEHFRVLTITPSPQRRDNLRKVAIKAAPVKGGSSMFWFACEKDYFVDDPETILGPIWITAKDQRLHSLLE